MTTQLIPADLDKFNQLDLEQPRNEHLFTLPDGLTNWLINNVVNKKQPEHIYILYVMINIFLTSIPLGISLYFLEGKIPNIFIYFIGSFYLIFNIIVYTRSFILALHYSTHTPIFNKKWRFLKHINTTFLCAFFGIPPLMYYPHHIAMHHSENNIAPHDVSSTMGYQRDSKLEHFKYMLRFALFIWFELPYHLILKKRYKAALHSIIGEVLFFTIIAGLFALKPITTLFVFILPTLIMSFALMEGNWKQHIFVDPDEPNNNYRSTFACINNRGNSLNFNDGYHIEHHENPGIPWFSLPKYFQQQLPNYIKNDGFIFTGLSSGQVGTLVLNGKLEELADHYVNIGQKQRTKAELVEEFKRRLQKIPTNSNQ